MDYNYILSKVDHTLLKPESTWDQVKQICEDSLEYSTACVCIPASFVRQSSEFFGGRQKVCTVIGFPTGYSTKDTKVFETKDAIKNGADEIDMVINIGWLKDKKYNDILNEIKVIKKACGDKILKVIIETCLLTDDEKIKMCEIVTESGADYIKTSTGFSSSGATFDDIALFAKHVGENVKIKAAGGINDFDDAQKFIDLGAERLGTSRLIKLVKNK